MPLPTFVVAGAQKCGTSTLHGLLQDHPQILMSRPKELHFFDRHWDRGLDWYTSQFTPGAKHRQFGESTPVYMYDVIGRQRMIETLPDARIVVILRDPIKRAYSHYWQYRETGRERAPTFERALEVEPKRLAGNKPRRRDRYAYVDRGLYVDQLEVLEDAYGRERLHVLLLDDLAADRVAALEALFSFLDVAVEPAKVSRERWGTDQAPGNDREAEPKRSNYPPMAGETHARLAEQFRPYNQRLASWLGRDLAGWG